MLLVTSVTFEVFLGRIHLSQNMMFKFSGLRFVLNRARGVLILLDCRCFTGGQEMNETHPDNTFELRDQTENQHSSNDTLNESTPTNESSLPPYDGGIAAWRLLIAAFVFEALLWGQYL